MAIGRNVILLKKNKTILKMISRTYFYSKLFHLWTFYKIRSYWTCESETPNLKCDLKLVLPEKRYLDQTGPCNWFRIFIVLTNQKK